jgi:hypothetical protein
MVRPDISGVESSGSATGDFAKLSLLEEDAEGAQLTCVPYSGDPWVGPKCSVPTTNDPICLA